MATATIQAAPQPRAAIPQFETFETDVFSPYRQRTVRAELTYETTWDAERLAWRRFLVCLREENGLY